MTAFVVTSTRSRGLTGRLLAALVPSLGPADRLYVESGVMDPRDFLGGEPAVPVHTSEWIGPGRRPISGTTVVGLTSAAAAGWERWAQWTAEWTVVVVYEGHYDHLRWIASDIPGLTWIARDELDLSSVTLEHLLATARRDESTPLGPGRTAPAGSSRGARQTSWMSRGCGQWRTGRRR